MAKKSKGFGEPLHHKQHHKNLQRLARRVRNQMGDNVAGVINSPFGQVKMTEVLQAFVEPYIEETDNRSQRQQIFEIAVIAWNLAVIDEAKRQPMLDQAIDQVLNSDDIEEQKDFRDLLEELIDRKLAYFDEVKRMIINFELKDVGREYQLSVASLMDDPNAQGS